MKACSLSSCEGVLPKLYVVSALLSTVGELLPLKRDQSSAESEILFYSQVDWSVSLLFEFSSCSFDSFLAQHSQNLGNVLSHLLDLGQLHLRLRRNLLDSQLSELFAVLGEFFNELGLFVLSKLMSFQFIHFA